MQNENGRVSNPQAMSFAGASVKKNSTLGHHSQPKRLGYSRNFSLKEEHPHLSLECNHYACHFVNRKGEGRLNAPGTAFHRYILDESSCLQLLFPLLPSFPSTASCECVQVLNSKPVSPVLQPHLANDQAEQLRYCFICQHSSIHPV